MIEGQRTERTIFVVTAARKLNRENRFGREIEIQRESVIIRGWKLVYILRIEGLIDRDLPVLPIDQVGHFTVIFLTGQLIDQFQQGCFPLEYDDIIGELEQAGASANVVH